MTRAEFLTGLLGKTWEANARGPDAFDCFHLFRYIECEFFSRDVGDVIVPPNPSWSWMIDTIERHPQRAAWRHVESDAMGIVRAKDGAGVLMARRDRPAHIGVWLAPERRIIHADPMHGVVIEAPVDLRTKGWTKLMYYEPI